MADIDDVDSEFECQIRLNKVHLKPVINVFFNSFLNNIFKKHFLIISAYFVE